MATAIRPEDLPAAPALSATDALIVDTGDGVFKTTPQEIVEAGGADVELRTDLAEPTGGSLIGMPDGKTLALAAIKAEDGGLALIGSGASSVRPEGQLYLSNVASPPSGHTIITLDQLIADEEAAIEFVGRLSNAAIQQMCAQFVRWTGGDNDPATYNVVWAIHGVGGPGQDNTTLEVWFGSNSARVCRGDTSNESWNDPPPDNVFEVWTEARVGTAVGIGPAMLSNAASPYVRTPTFNLEVQDRAQIGTMASGSMTTAVQVGHNGSTGFIQSYNNVAGVFSPLALGGSAISVGNSGQQVGFMGATPVSRPTVTGSRGGNAALASLLTALAALGLVTDSSTA